MAKHPKIESVEINHPTHGKVVFNPKSSVGEIIWKSVEDTFELALVTIQFEKDGVLWKISGNPKRV